MPSVLPRRLLFGRASTFTRPTLSTVTPIHVESSASVVQLVFLLQSPPPVEINRAVSASRSIEAIGINLRGRRVWSDATCVGYGCAKQVPNGRRVTNKFGSLERNWDIGSLVTGEWDDEH